MLAVWLNAMLHDGQESLDKASNTGPASNVLYWAIHVIRAEHKRECFRD